MHVEFPYNDHEIEPSLERLHIHVHVCTCSYMLHTVNACVKFALQLCVYVLTSSMYKESSTTSKVHVITWSSIKNIIYVTLRAS